MLIAILARRQHRHPGDEDDAAAIDGTGIIDADVAVVRHRPAHVRRTQARRPTVLARRQANPIGHVDDHVSVSFVLHRMHLRCITGSSRSSSRSSSSSSDRRGHRSSRRSSRSYSRRRSSSSRSSRSSTSSRSSRSRSRSRSHRRKASRRSNRTRQQQQSNNGKGRGLAGQTRRGRGARNGQRGGHAQSNDNARRTTPNRNGLKYNATLAGGVRKLPVNKQPRVLIAAQPKSTTHAEPIDEAVATLLAAAAADTDEVKIEPIILTSNQHLQRHAAQKKSKNRT